MAVPMPLALLLLALCSLSGTRADFPLPPVVSSSVTTSVSSSVTTSGGVTVTCTGGCPPRSPPTYSPTPYSPRPPAYSPTPYGLASLTKPLAYAAKDSVGLRRLQSVPLQQQGSVLGRPAAPAPAAVQLKQAPPAVLQPGTVLQLQVELGLHTLLYRLVWEERVEQVELSGDGQPVGPVFSLGAFESRDGQEWSYSGGSKEWCAARREARVVFTPRPAPGARYALDFVEEVSPCSFLLHVSGPTLAAAQR